MKNILLLTVTLILFLSCNKDDDDKEAIIGNWQVIEYCEFSVITFDYECVDIENGYTVYFNENGVFTFSEGNSECLTGTFTYDSRKTTLQFNSNVCSVNDGVVVYDYSFIDNKLKLSLSVENSNCDEGCYEIFNRIAIEE